MSLLFDRFNEALEIENRRVVVFEKCKTGFLCFNSATTGSLARGRIGEQQFASMGNEIDRNPEIDESFSLVTLLHHHPIPVQIPDWYKIRWYEKLFGKNLEKTECLIDSELFLNWIKSRRVIAALHGHKHIPRLDTHQGIAIVGCGSSVGKVTTQIEDQTYISLNLITIDNEEGKILCRLRAETIPGAGLDAGLRKEIVQNKNMKDRWT